MQPSYMESSYDTLLWVPEAGPGTRLRLDAANLFLLACREGIRDGQVDSVDDRILRRLHRFLRLSADTAARLFLTARREYDDGALPLSGPLDRAKLFRKACQLAWVDGGLEPEETRLLEGLAIILELPRASRNRIFLDVKARLGA